MKLSIVSRQLPTPEGTATGRALLALCEGLIAEGHDIDVWSWWMEHPPREDLPAWCRWEPIPVPRWLPMKARAIVRPRTDVAHAGWRPRAGAVALADDPMSFPAVSAFSPNAVTFHYLTKLDARTRAPRLADMQDLRSERAVARSADVVTAFSTRVAEALPRRAVTVVPIGYPMPAEPIEPNDRPVAVMLANWGWPPNRVALAQLLEVWPSVREVLPHAELVLAGRELESTGVQDAAGVRLLGTVGAAVDALAEGCAVVFPCPPSSGPKIKVLESLAHGLPVVTTTHGAEGIAVTPSEGLLVTELADLGPMITKVLRDPGAAAELGARGRQAAVANHSPQVAARARVAALSAAASGPLR